MRAVLSEGHAEVPALGRRFAVGIGRHSRRCPGRGARVTATALMRSTFAGAIGPDLSPFPRTSDLPPRADPAPSARLRAQRQLLRAARQPPQPRGQERQYELGRQRLAVEVTRAYYQVIQQRQLMAVARQSLERSESLRRASVARLEVGLVSKLDVYRAELQASQAQESMVRAETSLDAELERFRTLLGLSPGDPLQPEPVTVPEDMPDDSGAAGGPHPARAREPPRPPRDARRGRRRAPHGVPGQAEPAAPARPQRRGHAVRHRHHLRQRLQHRATAA